MCEELSDEEDEPLVVGGVGPGSGAELRDVGMARAVGVVHEEAAVLRVAGMEGEAEEPALAAAADAVQEVEERRGEDRAGADDPDAAGLLHDEQP